MPSYCSDMKAHDILITVTVVKGLQESGEGKLTQLRTREIGLGSEPQSRTNKAYLHVI